ncbi:hypothetical protein JTE90_007434 [Oedothorax gibbosus]|uniref:Reverse transcriptase domain-containing protein n=1 Tax=Oedothorax gibbosus TaxID=931172 RepID=A0AAV6UQI4_9ARAC|nr:hypothetical protein JTE90_007434 [Oedothorax gibbosus]
MALEEARLWDISPGATNCFIASSLRRAARYKGLVTSQLATLSKNRHPSTSLEASDSEGINHTTTLMTSPERTPMDNSLLYNTIVYHWASDCIEELDHSPVGTWEYLLDSALAYTDLDPDEALTLSERFILLAIPTETPKISKPWKRCRKPKPIHISKCKFQREKHAIVQRLYAKNRSASYESFFKEDSFSEKLTSEQMFASCENLLKDSHEAESPGDSRPISIASVILRHFHKILAKRLSQLLESVLDKGQFGFWPKYGIAEAINILDSAFEICQGQIQPLTLALFDLKKAFDSISHASIYYSLEALGILSNLVNNIKDLYSTASTKLHFGGNIYRPIIPSKGVIQGDPFDPCCFSWCSIMFLGLYQKSKGSKRRQALPTILPMQTI